MEDVNTAGRLLMLLIALAAAAPNAEAAPANRLSKAKCESLGGTDIEPSQIAIPSGQAHLKSAEWVKAKPLSMGPLVLSPNHSVVPATPDFCKVLGQIDPLDPKAPNIQFQINLPASWNGRAVQHGGGAFNGVLISGVGLVPAAPFHLPSTLARGYVTYGTDSGHQNKEKEPPQTFALNDEAFLNFAHASYKKVHDVAVHVMRLAYAKGPDKLFYMGSSEGGREGLVMAQRYPADFDGIFSRVPVINWTGLQLTGIRNGLAVMGDAWVPPEGTKLVHESVLSACDAKDGIADRIVSDSVSCRKSFDVAALLCPPKPSGPCLTAAQVEAVKTLYSPMQLPFELAHGVQSYPGCGPGGENVPSFGPTGGWGAWWTGKSSPSLTPTLTDGIAWAFGVGAARYFFTRDPTLDVRKLDPTQHKERILQVSALMDAMDPDLSAFHARGGKLILLENMADYAQSPYAAIEYVDRVVEKMGRERVNEFVRLYTAPSVDHMGTGAPGNVDILSALEAWTQGKQLPALTLLEQDITPPFKVKRSRPLCEWPAWPKYQSGNPDLARSFKCVRD